MIESTTPPDCSICGRFSRHIVFYETWLCQNCLRFLRALKADDGKCQHELDD
jgi:hypothetical protein